MQVGANLMIINISPVWTALTVILSLRHAKRYCTSGMIDEIYKPRSSVAARQNCDSDLQAFRHKSLIVNYYIGLYVRAAACRDSESSKNN